MGRRAETLCLPAGMESLEAFRSFVLGRAAAWGLPEGVLQKVDLVLEEVLVNSISYAYPEGRGQVEVACSLDQGLFRLTVSDQGRAFDPLARKDPAPVTDLDKAAVGGLGIHLVRAMSDEQAYRRTKDKNELSIGFRLPDQTPLTPPRTT
ncbi:MAG: ATP-binding protein [Desulfovibrionaceae bacterium]|nr:ATP-binding protein [Desulfovibrionaceae bacterium]